MSLTFYPNSHRYRLDGRWVQGVTTLIKGGLPNDAFKYWSARHVAEYVADHPEDVETLRRMGRAPMVAALKETPWQKRDEAAVRGTEVHALAERLIRDEEVPIPDHLDGYVQSCVAFLDEWEPVTVLAESPVAHREHWWAGRLDAVFRLPDGRVVIVDWKTSTSGIWPETAFQLAAYSRAEFHLADLVLETGKTEKITGTETPMPEVDEAWGVWLRRDGYDAVPIIDPATRRPADLDQVYKEFRHIAFVAAAARRAKGDRNTPGYLGAPLEPPPPREETAA